MPIVITMASRKGGVGKTTTSCGLASLLAAGGKAVLGIDLDPQSNLAMSLGGDAARPGTALLLTEEDVVPQVITDDLHVLAGGPALNDARIQQLDQEELAFFCEGLPYDYVVIDCPPGNETLERFGLIAANIAIIPMEAHSNAFVGATQVADILRRRRRRGQRGPSRWAVVANRLDGRRSLDREIDEFLEGFDTTFKVPQDAAVARATNNGTLLSTMRTPGVQALRLLAKWVTT